MSDWFRSVMALGISSIGVAVLTIGLAGMIVPGRGGDPQVAEGSSPAPSANVPHRGGIGGTLRVTGDLEGTFRLAREGADGQYSLVGDDGRIAFQRDPTEVIQVSYQGWEFFPDPGACSITPGEHDPTTGIAVAELECADLTEVRDKGTLAFAGTIGIAADLLGLRGDLPESGGTVAVGDTTFTFPDALLLPFPSLGAGYNMELIDEASGGILRFTSDRQTHVLALANVAYDGAEEDIPADACSLDTKELGRLNPRVAVVELQVECPEVEVPGLGVVPISGTLIVEYAEFNG